MVEVVEKVEPGNNKSRANVLYRKVVGTEVEKYSRWYSSVVG